MPLAPGTCLGSYEITGPLGAGGMGEVYKARDTRLGRTVAIKVLNATLAADPAFSARFESEARTLSQIAHPNICVLHDIGTTGGTVYLVLEYLEGETLADRIARGLIPFDVARRIGSDVCRALETAHRAGVVHRDLKPGNVMLTKSGAKLLDFGLAREHVRSATGDVSTAIALTQAGTIVGTAPYMSPEQLQGHPADPRSDIFALGAVLYEAFTGRRAFAGASPMAIAAAILSNDLPAPSTVNRQVPRALDPIVQGCLARDPDARWQSAHDVGRQLDALHDREDALPPAARWRIAAWLPWLVAALGIATAAGAWMVSRSTAPSERPTIAFQVPQPKGTLQFSSVEGNSLALSPDGSELAWIAYEEQTTRVWLRPLGRLEGQPLAGTDHATALFWSPDGLSIAFFAKGTLQRVDLPSSAPVTICAVQPGIGYTGTWGAGGQILFAPIQGEAIYRVSTSGGSPEKVIAANRGAGERRVAFPWFLGDGRTFIYLLHLDGGGSFLMLARDGQPPLRIAEMPSEAQYVDPGYLVFARDGALVAQRFDASSGRLTGDLIPLASHVESFPASGWGEFSAARTGTIAYGSGGDLAHIAWIDSAGREAGTIGEPADYLDDLAAAPDGQHVLGSRADTAHLYDVWSIDLARGTATRLTSGTGTKIGGLLRPDGRHLIYSRTTGGAPELQERDLDSGREERLAPVEAFQQATAMTRDGRAIVYMQRTDRGDWDLWTLRLDGTPAPTPLAATPFNETDGRLSLDDRLLAFVSNETNQPEVYVAPFATPAAKVRVSDHGGRAPRWAADGRTLLYIAGDERLMRTTLTLTSSLQVGTPAPMFATARSAWRDYLSLPGNRILAIVPDSIGREQPMTVIYNALPPAR